LTEHMLGRGSMVLVLDALVGMSIAAARVEAKTRQASASARLPKSAQRTGAEEAVVAGQLAGARQARVRAGVQTFPTARQREEAMLRD